MDSATIAHVSEPHPIVPDPPFGSFMGLARHIAVAGVAGLFTGVVVGGMGGRLFMRIAGAAAPDRIEGFGTEAGFRVGEVTFGGSLALIIFIGLLSGVAGAALFLVFDAWMSWARWARGLVFGVLLFGLASATSDMMNPDNFDFTILGNSALLVALIFLLFLTFGVVMDRPVRFLDRRFPGVEGDTATSNGLYVALAVTGLLAVGAIVPILFTDGFCDCDPPLVASWSVVVAGLGTLIWWATSLMTSLPSSARHVGAFLGFSGLAGSLVFGLFRAITDAIEIIG